MSNLEQMLASWKVLTSKFKKRGFRFFFHCSSPTVLRGARYKIIHWREIITDIKIGMREPLLHRWWHVRASHPAQQLAHHWFHRVAAQLDHFGEKPMLSLIALLKLICMCLEYIHDMCLVYLCVGTFCMLVIFMVFSIFSYSWYKIKYNQNVMHHNYIIYSLEYAIYIFSVSLVTWFTSQFHCIYALYKVL